MFNKKGVDAIVATVLIIMITVAAVAILWAFVIPMIKNSLDSSTSEKVSLTIETVGGYTTWDAESEQATVQIKRGVDGANFSKMKITFFNGKTTYSEIVDAPLPNTGITYTIPLIGFGKPLTVSISAVYNEGKEGQILSEVNSLADAAGDLQLPEGKTILNHSSGQNVTVPTNYNVHSCTSSYLECDYITWNENVPVNCPFPTFCTVEDFPPYSPNCYDLSNLASGRCSTGQIGNLCTADSDCFSGRCATDIYCDSGPDWCRHPSCVEGNAGDHCDSVSDCKSRICSFEYNRGYCSNGEAGVDGCYVGTECASGICDTYNYICKANKSVGSGCGSNGECDTNFCNSSNMCS